MRPSLLIIAFKMSPAAGPVLSQPVDPRVPTSSDGDPLLGGENPTQANFLRIAIFISHVLFQPHALDNRRQFAGFMHRFDILAQLFGRSLIGGAHYKTHGLVPEYGTVGDVEVV